MVWLKTRAWELAHMTDLLQIWDSDSIIRYNKEYYEIHNRERLADLVADPGGWYYDYMNNCYLYEELDFLITKDQNRIFILFYDGDVVHLHQVLEIPPTRNDAKWWIHR